MTDTGAGDPTAIMVPCDRCQAPHQYGERCEYCGYTRPSLAAELWCPFSGSGDCTSDCPDNQHRACVDGD